MNRFARTLLILGFGVLLLSGAADGESGVLGEEDHAGGGEDYSLRGRQGTTSRLTGCRF